MLTTYAVYQLCQREGSTLYITPVLALVLVLYCAALDENTQVPPFFGSAVQIARAKIFASSTLGETQPQEATLVLQETALE